jgi:hypothetical protein
MKLRVGLFSTDVISLQALRQENISHDTLPLNGEKIEVEQYPVLVVPKMPHSSQQARIQSYCARGGALITTAEISRNFINPDQKVFIMPDPRPVESAMGRIQEKKFYFSKGQFVTEKVAQSPAGSWRREFVACLKSAFWSQGLPYVRMSYYPAPYRGLFMFRMDLDHHIENDFQALLELIRQYPGAITCFVNTLAYQGSSHALKQLVDSGVRVGSHGHVHHVYDRYT